SSWTIEVPVTVSVCPVCTVPETLAMVGVVAKAMDGKPRTTIAARAGRKSGLSCLTALDGKSGARPGDGAAVEAVDALPAGGFGGAGGGETPLAMGADEDHLVLGRVALRIAEKRAQRNVARLGQVAAGPPVGLADVDQVGAF